MWQRKNNSGRKLSVPVDTALLRSKAAGYCALSEHCPSEVSEKLFAWGADSSQAEEVVDWLIDENFISEERYCHAFVGDKIRFQGWGKDKIRMALSQKRLPQLLIREALDDFPEEEYLEKLKDVFSQKARSLSEDDPQVWKAKMFRFLASRGFSFSDISKVLSDISEDSLE